MTSGGGLTLVLEELLQCGFIQRIYPSEDSLYRLADEFSLFYFRFLHNRKGTDRWSVFGAKRNEHFLATVAQDLTLDVLFD